MIATDQRDGYDEARELLTRLRTTTSSSLRKETLICLEEACDELEAKGQTISASNIERLLAGKRGGKLKAQSIRNDAAGLAAYVAARKRRQQMSLAAKDNQASRPRGDIAESIEAISDPLTRSRLRFLNSEAKRLRLENSHIQAALLVLQPGLDIMTLLRQYRAAPDKPIPVAQIAQAKPAPPDGVVALRSLLLLLDDEARLQGFGLQNDGSRIKRENPPRSQFVSKDDLLGLRSLLAHVEGRTIEPTIIDGSTPLS